MSASRAEPFTLAEIAGRLERAADAELFSINLLELSAARTDDPACRDVTTDTRRQAHALSIAGKIARMLAKHPEMALGLNIDAVLVALPEEKAA